jgi:hypothetical protein
VFLLKQFHDDGDGTGRGFVGVKRTVIVPEQTLQFAR